MTRGRDTEVSEAGKAEDNGREGSAYSGPDEKCAFGMPGSASTPAQAVSSSIGTF